MYAVVGVAGYEDTADGHDDADQPQKHNDDEDSQQHPKKFLGAGNVDALPIDFVGVRDIHGLDPQLFLPLVQVFLLGAFEATLAAGIETAVHLTPKQVVFVVVIQHLLLRRLVLEVHIAGAGFGFKC